MQNTTDLAALMQSPRNIYIAVAKARCIIGPGSTAEAPANRMASEPLA
ncbi:MAG TPA: hypothetical protein VFX20_15425 [Steroidobacteraceae bacterium]|nr:hypothetical protein [Steroidobacteraceae bacterium]